MLQAGSLTVKAQDTATASDTATVGSGGAATGRGTDTESNVTPAIQAYLGKGVQVTVTGG